jgi:hypothetical protein
MRAPVLHELDRFANFKGGGGCFSERGRPAIRLGYLAMDLGTV